MAFQPQITVIYGHTHYSDEDANSPMIQAISDLDFVTIRNLRSLYGDGPVDVKAEQECLISADVVVLQFPFYWYSAPHNLKRWLDEVLEYGFAYGSTGTALHGKRMFLAITTGGPQEAYQAGGYNNYSLSELLKPFQQTATLCGMHYMPSFQLFSAPNKVVGISEEVKARIQKHAEEYRKLLIDCRWNSKTQKEET